MVIKFSFSAVIECGNKVLPAVCTPQQKNFSSQKFGCSTESMSYEKVMNLELSEANWEGLEERSDACLFMVVMSMLMAKLMMEKLVDIGA